VTKDSRDIRALLAIMAALRDRETGCAWDIAQTFATIAPYTLEEAHEVVEAIASGDREDLREELGDLLLQVVFHARMAEEEGAFDFGGVVEAVTTKMIRRHPHVFGERRAWSQTEIRESWNRIKAEEKAERRARRGEGEAAAPSLLSGVPRSLPPAQRALRLQDKAASVGFDWPDIGDVIAKAEEELAELKAAVNAGQPDEIEAELGDLLFVLANVARWRKLDVDVAMAKANAKFERRFKYVEDHLRAAGKTMATSTLAEMDTAWNAAKRKEKSGGASPPGNADPT
jgi:nucleoside triphosphate diphosphatase